MAFETLTALKASIADILNRDDLTASIPVFIALAESAMNRDLRHWRMEERAVRTIDGRYELLPDNWLETKRLTIDASGSRALIMLGFNEMARLRGDNADATGQPKYFAHVGGEIEVYPTPSTAYTGSLFYYEKIPALSASQPTNWVLDHAPDVYFYGSLMHSAAYLREDERLATWASLYGKAVVALNGTSSRAEHSGTGLRMRLARQA